MVLVTLCTTLFDELGIESRVHVLYVLVMGPTMGVTCVLAPVGGTVHFTMDRVRRACANAASVVVVVLAVVTLVVVV